MDAVNDLPIVPERELANCPCFDCHLSDCMPMSTECPMNPNKKAKGRHMDWESVDQSVIDWMKRRSKFYPAYRQVVIYANPEELLAHGITNPPRKLGGTYRITFQSAVLLRRLGYQ